MSQPEVHVTSDKENEMPQLTAQWPRRHAILAIFAAVVGATAALAYDQPPLGLKGANTRVAPQAASR